MENITPELLRKNAEEYRINCRVEASIKLIEEEMLKKSLEGFFEYNHNLWKNIDEEDYAIIKKVIDVFVEKGYNVRLVINDSEKNYIKISWK